jgi:hypothetical protein
MSLVLGRCQACCTAADPNHLHPLISLAANQPCRRHVLLMGAGGLLLTRPPLLTLSLILRYRSMLVQQLPSLTQESGTSVNGALGHLHSPSVMAFSNVA